MKRREKDGKRESVFSLLQDYPADALQDDGAVHILCDGSMYLENCMGILSLSENKVVLRMKRMVVSVEGTGLAVGSFSGRGVSLCGKIGFISLQRESVQ